MSDGCILRILDLLITVDGEKLSYRTLDVEQIGSVYETVMGFTIETRPGPAVAIKAGKNDRTPVFVDLAALTATKGTERAKFLKEEAGRNALSDKVGKALAAAKDSARRVDGAAADRRRARLAGRPCVAAGNAAVAADRRAAGGGAGSADRRWHGETRRDGGGAQAGRASTPTVSLGDRISGSFSRERTAGSIRLSVIHRLREKTQQLPEIVPTICHGSRRCMKAPTAILMSLRTSSDVPLGYCDKAACSA